MTELFKLYRDLLTTAGFLVNEEDFVSFSDGDKTLPMTIKKRRLILPTNNNLKQYDKEKHIAFHPLLENAFDAESPILERFRTTLTYQLNIRLWDIVIALCELGLSTDEHRNFSSKQIELLAKTKDVSKRTVEDLLEIVKNIPTKLSAKSFVSIYIANGTEIAGKTFRRSGIVRFPFYEQLQNEDRKVYDVTLRVKDVKMLSALLEGIFPNISKEDSYSFGSDSSIGSSLHALMFAFEAIGRRINEIIDLFPERFDADQKFSMDWVEPMSNLNDLLPQIRMIPVLSGNTNPAPAPEAVPDRRSVRDVMPPPPVRESASAPASAPKAPAVEEGKTTMASIFGDRHHRDYRERYSRNPHEGRPTATGGSDRRNQRFEYRDDRDRDRRDSRYDRRDDRYRDGRDRLSRI